MRQALLVISSLATLAGVSLYAKSIIRGTTRPHRMTRFLVFIVLSLNFAGIVGAHSNFGAVLYAGLSFTYGIILFALSLWRGLGGTSKLDFSCLAIALAGIAGWAITGDALVGVYFSIIADFAAYVPAFVKTWHQPDTESHWLYTFSVLAAGLSLLAYPLGRESIFQIYIVFVSLAMIGIIFFSIGDSSQPRRID